MGRAMFPPCCLTWGQTMVEVMKDNSYLLQKAPCMHCCTQCPHQQKTGLKVYWAWPCPSQQDPVSPSVSLSHQEPSISLLSFSIRGQINQSIKTIKTNQALSNPRKQWEHCVGPLKMRRTWWRVLTKRGLRKRERQTTSAFVPWEPHEQYEKTKW